MINLHPFFTYCAAFGFPASLILCFGAFSSQRGKICLDWLLVVEWPGILLLHLLIISDLSIAFLLFYFFPPLIFYNAILLRGISSVVQVIFKEAVGAHVEALICIGVVIAEQ